MINPTFEFENLYWEQRITRVAGVDEAGMGALAGPVVAGAVIFSKEMPTTNEEKISIRDSKTLSQKQREKAAEYIQKHALAWAVAEASVEEITELNIRRAAHLAMQRAVDQLSPQADILLIDGNPAQPHQTIPAVNLIDGDALSFSIAAASILAKVHRDSIMTALDKDFPQYGFAKHKGYGAKVHMEALQTAGPCIHHRTTYVPVAKLLAKRPSI